MAFLKFPPCRALLLSREHFLFLDSSKSFVWCYLDPFLGILQVARCTKIIKPGTEEAKYVINVKQIAKVRSDSERLTGQLEQYNSVELPYPVLIT
jgi:hypothetical protein